MVYYRRRVVSTFSDMLTLGLLPIASVVFLGWIAVKSILAAPAAQNYSLLGFLIVGLILLVIARFALRSPFFHIRRESWSPELANSQAPLVGTERPGGRDSGDADRDSQ